MNRSLVGVWSLFLPRGGTEGQTDGLMEGHTLLAPARATKMKKNNRLTRRCWWWRKTLITSITRFTTSLVHVSKTSNLSTLVVHRGKKGNRQSPIGKNCRKKWSDRLMMRRKISSRLTEGGARERIEFLSRTPLFIEIEKLAGAKRGIS